MKTEIDCVVCLFRQALNTARLATDDKDLHFQVLARLGEQVAALSFDDTPAGSSKPAYELVAEITGVRDPYKQQKRDTNQAASRLLPKLQAIVDASPDALDAALHASVAGNIIDLGIGHSFDIAADTLKIMDQKFACSAIEDFRTELRPGSRLLYLGDNSGEIVFDTILVTHLLSKGVAVTFVVKSGPIINDATMEDAVESGMTGLVKVITTGSDDIGINWDNVSTEFHEAFDEADMIVSKGHGNFETCNDRPGNIYFLLKAKCAMVANELGVEFGDIVFKHSRP